MIPARSVAASVVALGFAGTLTAPTPAFAVPATCDQPEHYAAQSSAELLRIDRLELGPTAGVTNRRGAPASKAGAASADADGATSGTPDKNSPSGTAKARPDSHEAINGSSPGKATAGPTSGNASGGTTSGDGNDGAGEGGGTGGSGGQVPDVGQEHRAQTLPAWEDSTGGQGGGQGWRGAQSGQGGRGAQGGQGGQGGGAGDKAIGGVGLGDSRAVLISDGPVDSAGAARILNGQVAGSAKRNDLVIQQAPPVNPRADERRTGSQRFGPVKVGAGNLSAHAVWAHGAACGSTAGDAPAASATAGDASAASAEISRVTIAGGGSGSLVRVPEKISSRSGTALRLRGGTPQSVASATITAGRISLVDNEVRIRVLRAPELRVSMTADGQSRMDYQPAVVEISGKNGKRTRLATAGDHIDITLSEEARPLESLPARLDPIGEPPLPKVPGLPVLGEPETTPAPSPAPGPAPGKAPRSTLRIALGEARQATSGNAIAARATAIRVTVVRDADKGQTATDRGPSGLVADLGIGMLAAAAVAPSGTGAGADSGRGVTSARTGAGTAVASAGLPITGPRVVSLFLAGAGLVIGGICAVALTSRRRRNNP